MPIQIGDMTLYTVADLADMLEVSDSTITKYIRDGMFRAKKIGRKWYVSDQSIQDYFRGMENEQAITETAPEDAREEPETPAMPQQVKDETQKVDTEDVEVTQLLKEVERLKTEAERLEKMYGEQDEGS